MLAALKELMKNGQYKAILTHWGIEAGAITNPKINGATASEPRLTLRGEHLRATSDDQTGRPEDIKAVPVRHPGRWVAAVIVLIIAASLVRSAIVTNPNFEWHVVGQYLFDSRILHGVVVTIRLTVISMVIGIVLGVILAVMRCRRTR